MLEEEIVKKLLEKQYTVTTAESCTGGLLAGRILNVPGASSVYNEGHITYSNEAKERLLGVSHETLVRYGAVSRQTAEEMARGVAKAAKAEIGPVSYTHLDVYKRQVIGLGLLVSVR